VPAILDFHNHLIPAVDDGAASLEESLGGIATMAAQGIDQIITTPHLRASLLGQRAKFDSYLADVQTSWAILAEAATRDFPQIKLWRGFEILLDVPDVDLSDPILRLAGSTFALVEFPFLSVPPNSARALDAVTKQGYFPIVAHPERYSDVQRAHDLVHEWVGAGASLQVNAGSLLGRYGPAAENAGWSLLELGVASYVCSDYHSAGACHTSQAFDAVRGRSDDATAELLFSVNPGRIPGSAAALPVGSVPPRKTSAFSRFWARYKS